MYGELKGEETACFIDSISTGHVGFATVHSDCASNTINRLITLFKRDIRTQQYKESFVEQILTSSIDYIIYLENYKVSEIIEVEFDLNLNKVKSKLIYELKTK